MEDSNSKKPTIIAPPSADDIPVTKAVETNPLHSNLEQANNSSSTPKNDSDNSDYGYRHPVARQFKASDYTAPKEGGEGQNLAGVPAEFLHLFEHDADEVILEQATRHPVGVFAIYAFGAITVFLAITALLFISSDSALLNSFGANSGSVLGIGSLVVLLLATFVIGGTLLAAHVYKKSRLILTNQKIVIIQYHSIISREVSQLNIGDAEDINVSQPTLFDRIFKTGTVTVETAGEQNNYVLTQIENPYHFARCAIQMREDSTARYGN